MNPLPLSSHSPSPTLSPPQPPPPPLHLNLVCASGWSLCKCASCLQSFPLSHLCESRFAQLLNLHFPGCPYARRERGGTHVGRAGSSQGLIGMIIGGGGGHWSPVRGVRHSRFLLPHSAEARLMAGTLPCSPRAPATGSAGTHPASYAPSAMSSWWT